MSTKFAGESSHATVGSFVDYNLPEHEQTTGSSLVSVYRGDGTLVGRFNRDQLEIFAKGMGLRSRVRADSNPGEELGFTLASSVIAAMILKGLLGGPAKAFGVIAPAARAAMRKLNEQAF